MRIRVISCGIFALTATSLFGQTRPRAVPCKDRPEFAQMNFWVGDWEVFNKDQKLSDTSVQPVLKDCGLEESWKATRGSDGKGLSTWDARTGKWNYFWISAGGTMSHFTGELSGNEMRFVTMQTQPDGSSRERHWSLFAMPDGHVRELSVGSVDGGKTWTTEYDYSWVKKKL